MSTEVKVPVLPESVEDATIAAWHKKAGDRVRRDENLVDLETDKVVLEVPAPADGILREIRAPEGATVLASDVLAVIDEQVGAAAADKPDPQPPQAQASTPAAKAETPAATPMTKSQAPAAPAPAPATPASAPPGNRPSPAARRVIEEERIDPSQVPGSGRGGRITKGDALAFVKSGGSRYEERVKMTRLTRVAKGESFTITVTPQIMPDLKAVERFLDAKAAKSAK